ncbi:MAG: D-2-hydroxyacid dehydrogenase [Clostridiales bacterium]|nr:D-2-hydroxyacid dehydrogenase [Candidatus Blautia equi]
MKKVCIKSGIFTEERIQKLRELSSEIEIVVADGGKAADALADAHAVVGNFSPDELSVCKHLEFLQLNSSGADAYAVTDKISKETTIATVTGAYGIGIAEYMVAMLLAMMKKIPAYLEDQKKAIWTDEGPVTTPFGKRVLILGTGNIGMEFAKRMRPFGCTIVGIRRRPGTCPAELDELYGMDALKEELAKADVIALALPGTAETKHLLDADMLANCKEGAYLMNVGRGNVIPLADLQKPEVTGRFAGIWLDVVEVEPLPEGHALFSVPNLLLTPHITGGFHLDLTMKQIFEISEHNLKAWLGEGEYKSVLDRSTGYCF